MNALPPALPTVDKTAAPPDPHSAPSLRWGVLGAGGIAHTFVRAASLGTASQVMAIGSRSLTKAEGLAADTGLPGVRAYGSYEELVADPQIDAIYVATPHSHHAQHAMLALEAGKPVLVEKAFTRNSAEALAVFELAERQGLFAMEAMWTRFLPTTAAVHAEAASGRLGRIVSFTADHGQRLDHDAAGRLLNPALAGGALLDLGVYPVSYAIDLFGVPSSIDARGKLTDTGVDGQETIILQFPQGPMATLTSTLWARTPTSAALCGADGRIELPGDFYNTSTLRVHVDADTVVTTEIPSTRLGFAFEIAEAARCISAGLTQSPRMPWQATLDVMQVLDEVRRQLGVVYPGE